MTGGGVNALLVVHNNYKNFITLQVVYNNSMATYDEVLALDKKLKIRQGQLQFLTIELYKSKSKLNPSFMSKTYNEKNIPY